MLQQSAELRIGRPTIGNVARLELDNLDRLGVYSRLHFQDRSFTNLEEFRYAGALARVLEEHGVSPGDRVFVMMPNSPVLNAAFQASWMIGAVIVPVMPQWTAEEIAEILRSASPKVALTVPALASRLREADALARTLRHVFVVGECDPAAGSGRRRKARSSAAGRNSHQSLLRRLGHDLLYLRNHRRAKRRHADAWEHGRGG